MKCEGLFTLVLFRPMRTSSHNPYHWTVCVCVFLSVCLSDYLHVHFVRLLFLYLLEILY